MDLRPFIRTREQLERGIALINQHLLMYQPFILAEDLEVGEGQNHLDGYAGLQSPFDNNVWARGFDFGERRLAADKQHFRACNAKYREFYEFFARSIYEINGRDVSNLSFAEIGCNNGLNLFNLALYGARECTGYDWQDMGPVFEWLNELRGTNVRFVQGIWDNLSHDMPGREVPEVDVMINCAFLNHQCDPMQFLSYICDRARKGVFLYVLMNGDSANSISYEANHPLFEFGRRYPLNFNNAVAPSRSMLKMSLNYLGFGEIIPLEHKFVDGWDILYAKRTSDVKSAYWDPSSRLALAVAGETSRTG